MIYWIAFVLAFIPITLFYPTKVIGRKNLFKGKCIYACNHVSVMDIIIVLILLRKKVYILSKKELFKNKFTSWFLTKLGAISIDRQSADTKAIRKSLQVLNQNKQLFVFPSGTRRESSSEVENLKNGISMIAIKTKTPIVPMVLIQKPKIFRLNKLIISQPIDTSKYYKNEINKDTYCELSNELTTVMKNIFDENQKSKKEK